MLTDDFAVPPEIGPNEISHKFLPIFALLETLDERYRTGRSILQGQYLHLFMLGVDQEFTGRGIAQRLVSTCLSHGLRKGYTHAVTEATGVISQGVFRKLGFEERERASYQDFKHEGQAVFRSIRGHEATLLMDRQLTIQ